MTALLAEAAQLVAARAEEVGVTCVSAEAVEKSLRLPEAGSVRFESGAPVRRITSRKLSGLWCCATTADMSVRVVAGTRSRDAARLRPHCGGIASEPLWLHWSGARGERVAHAPDCFARRAGGSAVLIDCRPVDRRPAADAGKFEATAVACALMGWEYRLLGAADPIVLGNVQWLSGYRHPRHDIVEMVAQPRGVFAMPTSLLAGADTVGEPTAVLPVLFHLLWRGELVVDLSKPMHEGARVHVAARR